MPMYYFDLCDDETIVDSDGTDLIDLVLPASTRPEWRTSLRRTVPASSTRAGRDGP
jgi:hypothetical protein